MPSESPALPSQPAAPHVVQAAAELPVPPELPRSVIGDRCVELYHPRTGALLASIPLPERGLAAVRKGDLLYVAHALIVSIVNLRTLETHQEGPPFADQPPDLPSHLRSKRLVDGLSAIYDVTDPASPQFQRFDAVDSSFHVVLAPAPTRTLNVQAQPQPGQGLIITGSTLLGIWLAHVTGSIIPIAMDSARDRARGMPCRGDLCYVGSIIGYATMGAATVVFGIPGAITLGVGISERRSSSPPRIIRKYGASLNQLTELAPLDFSVTPYASNTDFGLMATGRF